MKKGSKFSAPGLNWGGRKGKGCWSTREKNEMGGAAGRPPGGDTAGNTRVVHT